MESLSGGCHCQAVRFTVQVVANQSIPLLDCNVCTKKGMLHLIVPPDQFRLTDGESALATYTFNTGVAKHHFCSTCGISPFYRPRSHPNDYDVNARCLDDYHRLQSQSRFAVEPFNGNQWEANVASINPEMMGAEPQQ